MNSLVCRHHRLANDLLNVSRLRTMRGEGEGIGRHLPELCEG